MSEMPLDRLTPWGETVRVVWKDGIVVKRH